MLTEDSGQWPFDSYLMWSLHLTSWFRQGGGGGGGNVEGVSTFCVNWIVLLTGICVWLIGIIVSWDIWAGDRFTLTNASSWEVKCLSVWSGLDLHDSDTVHVMLYQFIRRVGNRKTKVAKIKY